MRLEAVGKRYGLRQPWVVRNVTEDVTLGRLIRLEGPNGSGKSTLLRIMAGALMPSTRRRRCARCPRGCARRSPVAQALLARPRLLVLDEAWTGLDQAARGTLDAAVGERLAEGGTVVFVDHDPARMADRVDERWQLAGGAVQIAAGPRDAEVPRAAQPVAGPEAASLADPASACVTVVIELVGLEAGSLPRLGSLAGVLAVWPDPALEYETGQRLELVRLTATVALSDAILRRLLGFDGVHVLRVRPAEWPGAGQ